MGYDKKFGSLLKAKHVNEKLLDNSGHNILLCNLLF